MRDLPPPNAMPPLARGRTCMMVLSATSSSRTLPLPACGQERIGLGPPLSYVPPAVQPPAVMGPGDAA